ncbi:MAG: hypothetical protein Nkreftii_002702 [Candidatus Nitrospira kreftii]|uniref:Uncharacterized protein n=1 Tax=Candidatus Nitrospira kreftii TaxID=2652173 RepID=A0A7S8FFN0_9BACT|nr:MAG: hypothetical protein Nkreftii_002702 [Candidatus Nitrospira kreftii]
MNFTALEERIKTSRAAESAGQDQAVDAMRQELQACYAEAKSKLPSLDKAVNEARAFLNKMQALAATCRQPLPALVVQHVNEMTLLCDSAPRQVREGLAAFENLSFSQVVWKDGSSLDVNQRTALLATIRGGLAGWHAGRRLQAVQAEITTYLETAQWPTGGTASATIPLAPEPAPEVRVRT